MTELNAQKGTPERGAAPAEGAQCDRNTAREQTALVDSVRRQMDMLCAAMLDTVKGVMADPQAQESFELLFADNLARVMRAPQAYVDDVDYKDVRGTIEIKDMEQLDAFGRNGLRNRTRLTRAALPLGLTALAGSFFYGCANLEEVALPPTLTEIGEYAFFGCERLKRIQLPDGLRRIGAFAFSYCESLEEIHIPATVERIDTAAFRCCGRLARIVLDGDSALCALGTHVAQNCAALERFDLPGGLRELPVSTFYGCAQLRDVVIPQTVKHIGDYAFSACDRLRRLTFGAGDTALAPLVFSGLKTPPELCLVDGETVSFESADGPRPVAEMPVCRKSKKKAAAGAV